MREDCDPGSLPKSEMFRYLLLKSDCFIQGFICRVHTSPVVVIKRFRTEGGSGYNQLEGGREELLLFHTERTQQTSDQFALFQRFLGLTPQGEDPDSEPELTGGGIYPEFWECVGIPQKEQEFC
ncbi:hypothetical protein AMECASPLE_018135 [Ameca splendens]|uniref:Uncharacterized protein n=1 Tax=Ameca splendens TaxID=208324 RepID=A0ABV0ZZ01_9TELE